MRLDYFLPSEMTKACFDYFMYPIIPATATITTRLTHTGRKTRLLKVFKRIVRTEESRHHKCLL